MDIPSLDNKISKTTQHTTESLHNAKQLIDNFTEQKLSHRIMQEQDSGIKAVKNTLASHIDFVSQDDFSLVTKRTINQTTFPTNYAYLFDYKAHSSKRWMYHQYSQHFPVAPSYVGYFAPSFEEINSEKTLHGILEKGIHDFVILDDALYSGEQVIYRQILPIQKFFKNHAPDITPTFHIMAPYIGLKAKNILQDIPGVTLSIGKQMKTVGEYLPSEQKTTLENNNHKIDGLDCVESTTLTYFSHKIADGHSFCEVVRPHIYEKKIYAPYKDSTSKYYKDENEEYDKYKDYVTLARLSNSS